MVDQDDVRRIALARPETVEADDRFAFSVPNKDKHNGFVWAWNERVEPTSRGLHGPTWSPCAWPTASTKGALLASGEKRFFTEPHYDGFPAILVRLPLIEFEELEALIVDAWRCQAPRALVEAFERDEPRGRHG